MAIYFRYNFHVNIFKCKYEFHHVVGLNILVNVYDILKVTDNKHRGIMALGTKR